MAKHDLNREEMLATISDLHKDVYGFRPRGMGYCEMTTDELSAEFSRLLDELEVVMEEDRRREERAIAEFEKMIAGLIECGAGDRETALRWFRDANADAYMGDESIRYDRGLPWDYDFDHADRNFFKREAERRAAEAA